MQSSETDSAIGRLAPPVDEPGAHQQARRLRARCARQEAALTTLGEALCEFRQGVRALKAENNDLRVENSRLRNEQGARGRINGHLEADDPIEALLSPDVQAPGAARKLVARHLGDRVAPSVLDSAQLLISELVTNSVRHSGVTVGDGLVVRVHLGHSSCRLEVEDPGRDGVIAPRPPDLEHGGGMGLNLVQTLSERWGLERAGAGGTRVWAQLPYETA
jgi:serine/threonine-protein kinase RsbW